MTAQAPRPTPRPRHAPEASPEQPVQAAPVQQPPPLQQPPLQQPPAQQPVEATFTGSVVAPMQILIGVVSGVLVAVILIALSSNLWPVAIVLFVLATAVGVYLAPVSLTVADGRVTIGQGRREREPLVLYTTEIRDAGLREMNFAQCLGFAGTESDERVTRLAVRPGTTLVLTLHNGERYLVSVTDGPAALRAIGAPVPR